MPIPAKALPAKARLTPSLISRLIVDARKTSGFKRHVVADEQQPGLLLVIGTKTARWTLRYRPRGLDANGCRFSPNVFIIDDAATMGIDTARAEAAALHARIAKGAHPTNEKAAERDQAMAERSGRMTQAQRRAAMLDAILDPDAFKNSMVLDLSVLADATLSQCVTAFALHGSRGNATTQAETKRHLRLALKELDVADIKAAELKPARVVALGRLHADRPATGRLRIGSLQRMYKWLGSVDAVTINPIANVALPRPPAPRTHVLSALEVQALWQAGDSLPEPRRDYLRLLLLLPLRRQELADTRRQDLQRNGDRLELVIDASRAKNHQEHRLPLVAEAREIVERLLALPGEPEDMLIRLSADGSAMNSWKRFQQAIKRASGLWLAFHDTRRLFASESGEHGLADFSLIDALLNHAAAASKSGAARSYHHARHTQARGALMTAWAALVRHAVGSGSWPREAPQADNVVVLNAGGGK
jgi:integrase